MEDNIFIIFRFLCDSFPTSTMIENRKSIRFESNIAKILDRAIDLFNDTGLEELADKWDRILNNYVRAKSMR